MDKLDIIFDLQKKLNQDIAQRRGLEGFSQQEWLEKNTLALVAELGEFLNETNFKWWKNAKEPDSEAIQEELIDILHFYISICLHAGMDAERLFEVYKNKNKENFDRQYGRSAKEGYQLE